MRGLPVSYTHLDVYKRQLWLGHGVAYPPLTLLVDAAVVALAGAHPYWSVVAMRLPALLGVALLGLSITRIARARGKSPDAGLWWGLLNPLLLFHFVGCLLYTSRCV